MPSTPADEADPRVDGRDARWAAHRSSRRAELIKAARRAVHHRGPDLSMDDLAAEIGTSKSILYRYFTDKSGLQSAVGTAVLDDLRAALGEAGGRVTRPRDRIAAMVDVYLGSVESSAGVYAFVTQPEATATAGALRGFVAEIEDIVAEALLPVLHHGGERREADDALAALWAAGVVGHVRSVAERWSAAHTPLPAHTPVPPDTPLPAHTPLPTESAVFDSSPAAPTSPSAESAVLDADDAARAVERDIAALDRTELTTYITDWLWTGAAGVARRARATRTRLDDATGEPA